MTAPTDPPRAVDLSTVGALFPIKERRCYLNNASIGPMCAPVVAAVESFMADVRDNGRNNYPQWCVHADTAIKGRIARLIGARADEIAFVKNTTEGLSIVANGLDWRDGDTVVVADIEYPSNVYCWMHLARRGVAVRWVRNRQGRIPVDAIAEAIDSRTRLVSLSAVQFSNGYRSDLAALGRLCRERGVRLALDAIQWVGALALDIGAYGVDFLAAGGHKWLLAPIGTGFFYCRRESLDVLVPPTVGYHSVPKHEAHLDYDLTFRPDAGRFEEALVNFPGIWGLDAAVALHLGIGPAAIETHILALTGRAIEGLRSRGYDIVSPIGDGERSGLLCFRHPSVANDAVAARLGDAGVDVAVRGEGLRISPSFYNDAGEIDRFLDALPAA